MENSRQYFPRLSKRWSASDRLVDFFGRVDWWVGVGWNTIVALNVAGSNASVEIQGGGDIGVSRNKILGSQFGVLLNLRHGPTGTLLISSNSFEEQKGANIALTQSVQGMEYANVVINGNEFLQLRNVPTFGEIYIGTGTPIAAARWLRHVVISDNVIGAGQGTPIPSICI